MEERRRHAPRTGHAPPLVLEVPLVVEVDQILARGEQHYLSVSFDPNDAGSDSDAVEPHISTCDHDQSSARP